MICMICMIYSHLMIQIFEGRFIPHPQDLASCCRLEAASSTQSSTCFPGWICTIQIKHDISQRQGSILMIQIVIYLICPKCQKLLGTSWGFLYYALRASNKKAQGKKYSYFSWRCLSSLKHRRNEKQDKIMSVLYFQKLKLVLHLLFVYSFEIMQGEARSYWSRTQVPIGGESTIDPRARPQVETREIKQR